MLRSMTGFGRCLVEHDGQMQRWEVRSVNGKHLDIKWHLPVFVHFLEPTLEKVVRRNALRGRLDISLQLQFAPGSGPAPVFDSGTAAAMLDCLATLASKRNETFTPDYNALLGIQRLWTDPEAEDEEDLGRNLTNGLEIALDDWNEARSLEGAALGRDLEQRLTRMEEWVAWIGERVPLLVEEKGAALRERLEASLDSLSLDLEEHRYMQEIVILADRCDVSEELTRLLAHLTRLRQLLAQGDDAGRRLDFTLQECFREINTCGNKVADAQISRIVVDIKNELERCREQVQNLE